MDITRNKNTQDREGQSKRKKTVKETDNYNIETRNTRKGGTQTHTEAKRTGDIQNKTEEQKVDRTRNKNTQEREGQSKRKKTVKETDNYNIETRNTQKGGRNKTETGQNDIHRQEKGKRG